MAVFCKGPPHDSLIYFWFGAHDPKGLRAGGAKGDVRFSCPKAN